MAADACLFFGQCWAGCIQFWIIYQLALGVDTAKREGPSKTNHGGNHGGNLRDATDKEKRVTAL